MVSTFEFKAVHPLVVCPEAIDGSNKFVRKYQLFSIDAYYFQPQQMLYIRTGLKIIIPKGFMGKLEAGNGTMIRDDLDVYTTYILPNYDKEIVIPIKNNSFYDHAINSRYFIAKLIVKPIRKEISQNIRNIYYNRMQLIQSFAPSLERVMKYNIINNHINVTTRMNYLKHIKPD